MIKDCEALQKLEYLTAENSHVMVEADARLVVAQLARSARKAARTSSERRSDSCCNAYWSHSSN